MQLLPLFSTPLSKQRITISGRQRMFLALTTEPVQDFHDLYQSLADFIRISAADGCNREQAKVGGYVPLLLMKARSDLLVGFQKLCRRAGDQLLSSQQVQPTLE